ncbi:radical SAM/SPASM domain-containing protein [Desulfurobacterium sp.]
MYDLKLSITRACNLKCKYCHYITNVDKHVLPASFWKDVLDQYKNFDLEKYGLFADGKKVTITGGEATLHPEFWEIFEYAKKLGFYVSLPTNGTYLTDELVKKFKDYGADDIIIAIDGNRENHDFLRGKGNFDLAVKGAELVKKHGIPLRITTCMSKYNYKDLPFVTELSHQLGAEILIIFHYVELGRGEIELPHSEMSLDEIAESMRTIYELQCKYKDIALCTTTIPHYWAVLKKMEEKGSFVPPYYYKVFPGCRAVKDFVYVTSDGSVFPCPLIQKAIGNLQKTKLHKIFESEGAKIYADRNYFKECVSCKYKELCGGCKVRENSLCPELIERIEDICTDLSC